MNFFLNKEQLEVQEILPGIEGRFIHMENMTVGHFILRKGAVLPKHHHPHEQVTNVLSGELKMTVDGKTHICRAGDIVSIPSGVSHEGEALTECMVIDVFQPVREDYKINHE